MLCCAIRCSAALCLCLICYAIYVHSRTYDGHDQVDDGGGDDEDAGERGGHDSDSNRMMNNLRLAIQGYHGLYTHKCVHRHRCLHI